eukprot:4069208-Amphidinium_carterae.1
MDATADLLRDSVPCWITTYLSLRSTRSMERNKGVHAETNAIPGLRKGAHEKIDAPPTSALGH